MDFAELNIKNRYRSCNCVNIGKEFLGKVLDYSVSYKRAVGFFSSSSLIYTSKGLAKIAEMFKEGEEPLIKFIVSPKLSLEDIQAIKNGYKTKNEIIEQSMLREFSDTTDKYETERLNMLSHLISIGAMDIKVAVTEFSESDMGMYHEKIGVLYDKHGNTISFTGSLNESENAFINNFESITVFKSWDATSNLCKDVEYDFDELWLNKTNRIEIYSFPKAVEKKLFTYKKEQYNHSIDSDEEKERTRERIILPCIDKSILPTFPYEYQKEAINSWFKNKCCGIFDMATGTGKTFTGCGAMVKLLEKSKYHLATVIICPYQHLVEQWVEDASSFHITDMIIGYSNAKYKDYISKLNVTIQDYNDGIVPYFYFITTNASYKTEKVQEALSKISGSVLFVADEAHNIGSEKLQQCLNPNFKYRLALSATIDRYRDEEGTSKIYDYFGNKCISYPLERAIQEEKLTKYYYHPIVVYLDDDERDEYIELTKQLSKLMLHSSDGKVKMSKRAEFIAIKRARLIAGARNKLIQLKEEMKKHIDDKFMLVYCGTAKLEGDSSEEISQIEKVCQILGNELKMKVGRYTSKESVEERQIIKDRFKEGNDLQALVAIKCLDEGVNIPSIRTAFILASSTNPREYIQRRGRVLRLAKGKDFAAIYDFICLPMEFSLLDQCEENEVELFKSLVLNEINRMKEFGQSSLNYKESDQLIEHMKENYGLYKMNIDDLSDIEWMEEENNE